ncbi:unnamed protein product [Mesocestoides corti]|uniref:ALS_ss_C domain-containing protein n=1 Tax=Mesocestoides corti TaxID=53468 RepID=A0A0R3UBT0_MESCO|nr:unnamed protein product [Mesocestoides corti]
MEDLLVHLSQLGQVVLKEGGLLTLCKSAPDQTRLLRPRRRGVRSARQHRHSGPVAG